MTTATEEQGLQPGDYILPNDPALHKRIATVLAEVQDSKTRVSGEKSFQKDAIKALSKETEVPRSFLNKLASWKNREGGRDAAISEIESLDVAYTQVFGPKP